MRTWSVSELESALRCAYQANRPAGHSIGPEAQLGIDVHRVTAAVLRGYDDKADTEEAAELVEASLHACDQLRLLGCGFELLSVESDGIPSFASTRKMYGGVARDNFFVPLRDGEGYVSAIITGAWDSLWASAPSETSHLIVADIKTGRGVHTEQLRRQGLWYVFAAMTIYPNFASAEFRPLFVREGVHHQPFQWIRSDMPAMREEILSLIVQAEADLTLDVASVNPYCSGCGLRSRCPAYVDAVTVAPMLPTLQALTLGALSEADERVASIAKIAESFRAEVKDEQTKRLAAGPVVEHGAEWSLRARVVRYDRRVEAVLPILRHAVEHGQITPEQFEGCISVAATGVSALKKAAPDVYAEIESASVPRTTTVITSRTISSTAAALPAPPPIAAAQA
ncbi:MAG: PD-(D/E)XK nuclease family protein, partial [Bacteroidota bacterium]